MTKFSGIFILGLAGLLGGGAGARAEGRGDEAFVVFNTRVPESKEVADHYAAVRQVPPGQVLGLDLPTSEAMARRDYREGLEMPLAKALQERKLFQLGSRDFPGTNGAGQRREGWVVAAKIRYLVLCYGVPLKISADPNLREAGAEKLQPELQRNDAAVDSELACLPLLGQNYLRSGPLMNPFYRTTNAAALNPTNGLVMVARLDGPTAAIANGLVDKAMEAETNGLWGRAYFDLRGLTNGPFKMGDDWLRVAADVCRSLGFETVVDENPGTFPVSFPLSQVALYAGWYDENASGPFARPTVEFMPGAFAYHLFSFSAQTIRTTTRFWVGPLLAKGVTATMGCVEEPFLGGTPDMAAFFARFVQSGFSFGEAAYACQAAVSWQTTVVGDPLYRPFDQGPEQQRRHLEQIHSKLLEWYFLRVINLKLFDHAPLAGSITALEGLEVTKHSAVLTEKVAELYAAQGKPASSVHELQEALKLDPSPQQRVRITLTLGSRLMALGREAEAYELYQEFLKEAPDYPDPAAIYRQLLALAQKWGKREEMLKYQNELSRLLFGAR